MSFQANVLKQIAGIRHEFSTIGATLPASLFFCSQVHSGDVIEASTTLPSGIIRGDAVLTRSTRPIAVVTADCLPILISSDDGAWVAAVHGGWKGLHGGIIANVLQHMGTKGVEPHQVRVAIGPSIKPCCYEVSADFITPSRQIRSAPGRPPRPLEPRATHAAAAIANPPPAASQQGSLWFDLSRYAVHLLHAAGVIDQQIEISPLCTYCSTPSLASYRRRGHRGEEKTFQYSWIGRTLAG